MKRAEKLQIVTREPNMMKEATTRTMEQTCYRIFNSLFASFLRNLSKETTLEDLHKLFDQFGKIVDAKVIRDRDGQSRFVSM